MYLSANMALHVHWSKISAKSYKFFLSFSELFEGTLLIQSQCTLLYNFLSVIQVIILVINLLFTSRRRNRWIVHYYNSYN